MDANELYKLWYNGNREDIVKALACYEDISVIYDFAKLLVEMEGGGSVGILLVILLDSIDVDEA
jgi:hypothetical protein